MVAHATLCYHRGDHCLLRKILPGWFACQPQRNIASDIYLTQLVTSLLSFPSANTTSLEKCL